MTYIEKPLLDDSGSMVLFNEFTQELQRYKSRDSYIKTHSVIVSNGDPKFNEYLIAPQHARLQGTDVSDFIVLPSCLLGSDKPVNYWAVKKDKKPLSFFENHHDFSLFGFVGSNLPTNKKTDYVHVVNELPAFFKLSACGLPCVFVPVANVGGSEMNIAQREAFKAVIDALESEGVKTYAPVAAHGVSTLKTLLSTFNTTVLSLPVDIDQHIDDKVLIDHLADEKAAADQQKWGEPKLISTVLPDVLPLRREMLPTVLSAYIFDQAERVPMPPDMVAVAVLTSLCGVLGARVAMKPKKYDDFAIVPNLWGAFIAPPSSKKSGALSAGAKPVDALAFAAQEAYKEQKDAYDLAQAMAKTLDAAEDKVNKAKVTKAMSTEGREAAADMLAAFARTATDDSEEAPSHPKLRRYKTNDSSPEALAVLEQDNPTGILVIRDELSGLLASLEGEANSGARSFYLEGWNGDSSYDTDRIMRGYNRIENHCLSILGGIQPDKLIGYFEQSIQGLGNDGLIQRFQLMVYPDPITWSFIDRAPDTIARDLVYALFKQTDDLQSWDLCRMGAKDADAFNKRPFFRFTSNAYQFYEDWVTQLETVKIKNEEHSIIQEHLSKYNKLMPALALVFHVIDGLELGEVGDVSLNAAEMAAEWCEYLESHARRVYSLVIQSSTRTAALLAEKLSEIAKTRTDDDWFVSGFTARQVTRRNWKGLTDPDVLQNALEVLVEDQWIMLEEIPSTASGGRPTRRYWINPNISINT